MISVVLLTVQGSWSGLEGCNLRYTTQSVFSLFSGSSLLAFYPFLFSFCVVVLVLAPPPLSSLLVLTLPSTQISDVLFFLGSFIGTELPVEGFRYHTPCRTM